MFVGHTTPINSQEFQEFLAEPGIFIWGGLQPRGSGDRSFPVGSMGEAPVGLENEVPQKLKLSVDTGYRF